MLSFLGDFQQDPTTTHPYMVMTAFEELVATKGIVLLRGDLIRQLDEDEGKTLLTRLLESYLIDSEFETVRKFNHEPAAFDFNIYIQEELARFRKLHAHLKANKSEKLDITRPKRKKHMTDAEMDIFKGGIIR